MFKATISDVGLLVNSISTIGELIEEGIFKITKGGIKLIAADRAMVAVVDFLLSTTAFDSYKLDQEQSIGLNIPNFLSILKRASVSDKIGFSLENAKLEVVIENASKRKFTLPVLDLREEEIPPIAQLEFTTKVEIMPDIFQSGIEDAEVIADSVLIKASSKGFWIKAEGDVSSSQLELEKKDKALLKLKAEKEIGARYPLDYLKKMIKAVKISDSLTLEWGHDYPMRLSFKSGDKLSLSFVLAPRITEE
jgi:proliferating cell nuclear antigen PCNA